MDLRFTTKYEIGELVYLRCCGEERRGAITGIMFRPTGYLYAVTWDDDESMHYELELSRTPEYKNGN